MRQKMTYTLKSVESTTTCERDNLEELYAKLKVKTVILIIRKENMQGKKTPNSPIMMKR